MGRTEHNKERKLKKEITTNTSSSIIPSTRNTLIPNEQIISTEIPKSNNNDLPDSIIYYSSNNCSTITASQHPYTTENDLKNFNSLTTTSTLPFNFISEGLYSAPYRENENRINFSLNQNIQNINNNDNISNIIKGSFDHINSENDLSLNDVEERELDSFFKDLFPPKSNKRSSKKKLCSNTLMTFDEVTNKSEITQCKNLAISRGLCKLHGGGTRCKIEGCERSSQIYQLCGRHGGVIKCKFQGCNKDAQLFSLCHQHGGKRICNVEGCEKKDRGNGACAAHGGGKKCSIVNCDKTTRRNGFCSKHYNQTIKKTLKQENK